MKKSNKVLSLILAAMISTSAIAGSTMTSSATTQSMASQDDANAMNLEVLKGVYKNVVRDEVKKVGKYNDPMYKEIIALADADIDSAKSEADLISKLEVIIVDVHTNFYYKQTLRQKKTEAKKEIRKKFPKTIPAEYKETYELMKEKINESATIAEVDMWLENALGELKFMETAKDRSGMESGFDKYLKGFENNKELKKLIDKYQAEFDEADRFEAEEIIEKGNKEIEKFIASLNIKPVVKAYSSDDSVLLEWNGVTGGQKYAVYQVADGKATKITETKSNSAKINNLKSGKTYKFIVRAKVYGKWTTISENDIIKIKTN